MSDAKPGRCWWRHDWAKWQIVETVCRSLFSGKEWESDVQVRQCHRCGLIQRRGL